MPDALYQPFPMLGVNRAHIWRYTPENRRPRHFHAEPELNLIAAGTAKFGIGESVFAVSRGDLLWFPPGQDHELVEASADFDLFVIGVTPELSARVLGAHGPAAYSGPALFHLDAAALDRFGLLCAAPLAPVDTGVVERHVGELWRGAHALRTTAPDMHTLTRRALVSLLERPELGRAALARHVRGYPSEVSRHFRRDMGLTLVAYRTRLRLLRFIEHADDDRSSLLAAALAAGFGSYSQCHRAFQRAFDCSPRAFFGTPLRDQMRDTFAPWEARRSTKSG